MALEHLVPARQPADGSLQLPIPVGQLRNLVAEGSALAQWRGTPTGLRRFLEIACGTTGFAIEEPPARRFHFVVVVPAAAADQVELVRQIVEREKPAATTYEIRSAETAGTSGSASAASAASAAGTPGTASEDER